jgi:hypothetical protein
MTSEEQKGKVIDLPRHADPPVFLLRRAPGLRALAIYGETEKSPEPVTGAGWPPSPEATRQMIHNIAGFFSQVAAWDTQETPESKAA